MKETTNMAPRWKKVLLGILAALVVVALAAAAGIYGVWHNEIATVSSMKLLRERDDAIKDGAVYTMHVKGGFYLDDFVAQGGVKDDTELIGFVTDKITRGLIDLNISDPEIACSSFTARNPEGDVLFARNYDFSSTNTCVVFTEKNEGRHATISTVDLQFLGMDVNRDVEGLMEKITCLAAPYAPLDGINDAGVGCGIYMTYQGGDKTVATDQNTDRPDFTSTTLLRLILDYADSVEEAVEIASSYDMHDSAKTSYHYMVADASGKSAILEWAAGTDNTDNDGAERTLKVTYYDSDDHIGANEAASDYQVITNFILQPGYYDGAEADQKRGYDRYERLWEELNQIDGVAADERAAMDMLGIVRGSRWWVDDPNSRTVHSAVYNLTDKTVLWVPNEHYEDSTAFYNFGFEK